MWRRPGLVVVATAVLVAVVVTVLSLRATRPTPVRPEAPITGPLPSGEQTTTKPKNLRIDGAEVTQRDKEGSIIWQARAAGRFDFDEATQTLQAENVHWELVRTGQEKLIVEAPQFAAHYKDKRIDFAQGVRVFTQSKSQMFEVDSLRYEFNTQKLIGEGTVTFRLGQCQATGKRLVIDNRAEQVRLTGPGCFSRLEDS